jgi:hypothetical protein
MSFDESLVDQPLYRPPVLEPAKLAATAAFGQFREYRTLHGCHIEHGLAAANSRVWKIAGTAWPVRRAAGAISKKTGHLAFFGRRRVRLLQP